MKPTQEQVIAWAREICGPEMPEWRDGTEMEWHEFHALALRCYEAGRKDENEAQLEPPCKTGSQCVGGKCERCAAQEWQGLTDAVVQTLIETAIEGYASNRDSMRWLCRAIEAKLRERNAP